MPALDRFARRGEDVVIARGKTPIARLVRVTTKHPKAKCGAMKGQGRLTDAFFEPLPPEELDAYDR
jgi:antitoxin (DNA-binding transcriptional repressor) of toxin-antitoxin stability system